ncbi:hypothetical protein L917_14752 [Phytophthora nicotianae]|nr:hypothetical protein L917_14752 [Phytophthora nicotianae]
MDKIEAVVIPVSDEHAHTARIVAIVIPWCLSPTGNRS